MQVGAESDLFAADEPDEKEEEECTIAADDDPQCMPCEEAIIPK